MIIQEFRYICDRCRGTIKAESYQLVRGAPLVNPERYATHWEQELCEPCFDVVSAAMKEAMRL